MFQKQFFICFEPPSDAKRLLLALHSRITTDRLRGPMGIQWETICWASNQVSHMQVKFPTCCVITPVPFSNILESFHENILRPMHARC